MEFTFEFDEQAASTEAQGKSFGVMDTGIYDVTITTGSLSKTAKGNNLLDLSIDTGTHTTTLYGAYMMDKKWASGAENFNYDAFQRFIKVAGLKNMSLFKKAMVKDNGDPIIKDGEQVVLNAFKELEGCKVKLAIVKELDYYQGKVREKNVVYDAFSAEGFSSRELITKAGEATAIGKLEGRLADKHTKAYKAYLAAGGENAQEELDTIHDADNETEDLI